jgi:hypothetical protein
MGRKKPTPSTLFDEYQRTNDGYMKRAEDLYGFLDRCARPEWEEVRREAELWYAEFPEPKRDLLRRFRKKTIEQHLPAWWELYVHMLFVRLGYKVEVHPQLADREEHPDFLVTRGTERLYVEATTAFNGDNKVNPQGQAWVEDFINSAQNPDFMVDIELPKVGRTGCPSRHEIVKPLEAWLAELDWAEARAAWDENSMAYMRQPRWQCHQEHREWIIEYLATPLPPESRGTSNRLISIYPTPTMNFSRDIDKIRAKLDDKGGNKYSSLDEPLDYPLVVALQLWHHVDQLELRSALFGSTQLQWLKDPAGGVVPDSMETVIKPDGYWRPGANPRGTRISAVLFGNTLSAYTVTSRLPELWLNPWAETPLPGLEPFQSVYVDDENKLATRDATDTAAAVFNLPPEWPNLMA